MNTSAAPLPPMRDDPRSARALLGCARPLVALATQLRQSTPAAPEAMKQALVAAVARFEREAAAAGCAERDVVAASYVLCAWVDEVVDDTPWGAGGAGLLQRFHGEADGSTKVLTLLSRLAEQPQRNRALLELFHACLSLGLRGALGRAGDAAQRLEALRRRVFLALAPRKVELAPPWQPAVAERRSPMLRRLLIGGLMLLGLGALGVYTTSHLLLARRADAVFASMQQLAPTEPTAAAASQPGAIVAVRAAPPLAPLLADDVAAGRLVVRDEPHRSVVTIGAEQLFGPDATRPTEAGAALLARVAAVLGRYGGKVLVIGHTDGADTRTARLPSAWHQSYEWASEAANGLAKTVPAARLSVEGAADLVERDAGAAAAPRRRVDIVLYP